MKRRWFAVMGTVLFVGMAVLLARFGPPDTVYSPLVPLSLASLLFVLGGLDPTPEAVPWYRFVGLGILLLGAVTVGYWLTPVAGGSRTTGDLAFALVGVVTAIVFGFMGLDWFRGGRHYDLSRIEPGPILGSRGDGEER